MNDNSSQDTCVSCGESSTFNISYSEGERITSCNICGSVVKYEKENFNGGQSKI